MQGTRTRRQPLHSVQKAGLVAALGGGRQPQPETRPSRAAAMSRVKLGLVLDTRVDSARVTSCSAAERGPRKLSALVLFDWSPAYVGGACGVEWVADGMDGGITPSEGESEQVNSTKVTL